VPAEMIARKCIELVKLSQSQEGEEKSDPKM
jgi:hypothetical protein